MKLVKQGQSVEVLPNEYGTVIKVLTDDDDFEFYLDWDESIAISAVLYQLLGVR